MLNCKSICKRHTKNIKKIEEKPNQFASTLVFCSSRGRKNKNKKRNSKRKEKCVTSSSVYVEN